MARGANFCDSREVCPNPKYKRKSKALSNSYSVSFLDDQLKPLDKSKRFEHILGRKLSDPKRLEFEASLDPAIASFKIKHDRFFNEIDDDQLNRALEKLANGLRPAMRELLVASNQIWNSIEKKLIKTLIKDTYQGELPRLILKLNEPIDTLTRIHEMLKVRGFKHSAVLPIKACSWNGSSSIAQTASLSLSILLMLAEPNSSKIQKKRAGGQRTKKYRNSFYQELRSIYKKWSSPKRNTRKNFEMFLYEAIQIVGLTPEAIFPRSTLRSKFPYSTN